MKSISNAAWNIDGQPMFKYLDYAKMLESQGKDMIPVSYTHLTLPTTPYV